MRIIAHTTVVRSARGMRISLSESKSPWRGGSADMYFAAAFDRQGKLRRRGCCPQYPWPQRGSELRLAALVAERYSTANNEWHAHAHRGTRYPVANGSAFNGTHTAGRGSDMGAARTHSKAWRGWRRHPQVRSRLWYRCERQLRIHGSAHGNLERPVFVDHAIIVEQARTLIVQRRG